MTVKNIGKKMLAVMSEVGKVGKDKTNSFHKYDYASDEAVVGAIRDSIIKNGLVVIPNQASCRVDGELTTLEVKYTIVDVDSGEIIESTAYGQGQDKGDKGVYKAATGAEKYFLLKTFLIATGDDAEKDSPVRNIQKKANGYAHPAPVPDVVKDAHQAPPADDGNFHTSIFDVSDPIPSKNKKGTFYRKAMDSEGSAFYVFDDHVLQDLQVSLGKMITVKLDTSSKWPRIEAVVDGGVAA